MSADLIPYAVTYQPRPFTLTVEQERDLLAYAHSLGMTPNHVIRHLEPGVRNLITLRRTILSYEEARARIDQLYKEKDMEHRQIIASDPKGHSALKVLESDYPDDFAVCKSMYDVYKALDANGYTYVPAVNVWQQQGEDEPEKNNPYTELIQVEDYDFAITIYDTAKPSTHNFIHSFLWNEDRQERYHAFGEATEVNEFEGRTWCAWSDNPDEIAAGLIEQITNDVRNRVSSRLFDDLPIRQREFLTALHIGAGVVKNGATRKALRERGFITETDDWDAIELTEAGRAVLAAVPTTSDPVADESTDSPDDPDEDAADSHALTVGAKVVYKGDFLTLPNNQFGIFTNTEGQITDLLDDAAMVAFNGRDDEVSVPLSDLTHYDDHQRELWNAQKDRLARIGDTIDYKGSPGTVVKLRAGGSALIITDGSETPIWVRRGEFRITRFAADQSREQLEALIKQVQDMLTISTNLEQQVEQLRAEVTRLNADKMRLQQKLDDAEKRANRPASLPPVGELDSLRAENARLRAELDAAKAPVDDEPDIPAGDLFKEMEARRSILARERARVRLAEPTKKEFKMLTKVREGQLEELINAGWEKFDSSFTSDADGVIDYNIVLARDKAQPVSNGTETVAKAEPTTTYIMPDDIPVRNGRIEETELTFADARALYKEGRISSEDVLRIGDLQAKQRAMNAVDALRTTDKRPMRHIRDVLTLPNIIIQETE